MSLFFPTRYRRRVTDVSLAWLREQGIGGLILDIDNTLTTHDNPDLAPEVTAWLEQMRAAGMRMMILSNNSPERVAPFAQAVGLAFRPRAKKPLPGAYRAAAAEMGVDERACAVIGDQIFTDIVGANLAGMVSVLLEPIEWEKKQKFIVFKRFWERLLLAIPAQKRRREEEQRNAE